MAVTDPGRLLELERPSIEDKYRELTRILYINGKPELSGNALERARDSVLFRCFGMLFGAGKRAVGLEPEYQRLTGNFKRIGRIARRLRLLGLANRLALRMAMRAGANLVVRQGVRGVGRQADFIEAAKGYFAVTDLFDFSIEVCAVDGDRVEFKFLECPIGYVDGDDTRICMATNKWDRQCVRAQGARLLMKELIPEGAPACIGHIVPRERKVPDGWRRYARFSI